MRSAMMFAVPLFVSGCVGYACTDLMVYSVSVSVVDATGAPYVPEDVTYSVDGGPETSCEPGFGVEYAHHFACGFDEPGDFVIRVYDAGAVVAEEAVEVRQTFDRCHVEPVELEIEV